MDRKLPLRALIALATAAFVTILTEALPAGLLPGMSTDLAVSESAMGQSVTVYALATALAAIPLSAVTAKWRRKHLLLSAIVGFAVANTVTVISTSYALTMTARFVAGVAAGVVWSLLAGYARRMAPEGLQGKAMAVVMAGIPIALSLGVPAGTFLGGLVGWRVTFAVVSGIAAVLIVWIAMLVPDYPGQRAGERVSFRRTLTIPGVAAILFVVVAFVLAHNVLYTYIAPFLAYAGGDVDLVLLLLGAASMAGIWIVGVYIDRRLRLLLIASTVLVAVAAVGLTGSPYVAAVLWGLGWGGVPTLLQTAIGHGGDTAQSMLVTAWNGSMAAGGLVGGIFLDAFGPASFPWVAVALLAPVLVVALAKVDAKVPQTQG
ncbi:MFS transporter [Kibdelosporangium persicum]|uniref:Purine ribonucleoside efflux pump NepI n=1 Tax=Kibdelosporangium persicum TaxID=2698649 RepID=A0ABX2EXS5_9PSEU|nr:MFS transporter [Kibdelosporangium persicum]NRN63493.1 Purine ribonucleoside efflux pump NepI [Kibdelosporangium persicum]